MAVKLVPHKGINVVTKQEQCFEQYFVLDGHPDAMEHVGIIGWKEGSKLIFLVPVDPIRADRIAKEVERQMQRQADHVACPEIDEDLLHPHNEDLFDELDESDLT